MKRNTTDHLPLDVGGNPKERKKHMMVLRERKRTAMIKPAAATLDLDVLPYSHVAGKMSKKKKKSSLLESEKKKMMNQKKQRKKALLDDEEEYDVPTDIWIEILLRLPFLTLLGVRLVCRAWNDIISRWQSHHHRNLTPAGLLGYSYKKDEPLESIFNFPPPPPPTKTYLMLVDLPSAQRKRQQKTFCPLQFKDVRHPCTLHDCSLLHTSTEEDELPPFLNLLVPEASCHGLVCFTKSSFLDHIFVGNPLLNEDLLMVPSSNTNLKTAATETENMWNNTDVACESQYLVGFGFSPKTNSYKVMQFMHLFKRQPRHSIVGAFQICTICNSSDEHEEFPSWRSLGGFPPQFSDRTTQKNPVGSYLKGGIHWLFCDETDDSIFISRLDLDTEEFGRVEVPQASNFKTNGKLNLNGMCLGVSDGYLNICASLFSEKCDIWVMKEYNSWTKQFVVSSPVPIVPPHPNRHIGVDRNPRVQLLNYAAAEASTRGGAVSEVMLLYNRSPLFACATKGGHIREVDLPSGPPCFIAHIPSLLSIKDAVKM